MLSYLLLKVEETAREEVVEELEKFECTVEHVKEVEHSEVLAHVVTDNRSRLSDFIVEQIIPMHGIKDVETIMIE